MTLIYASDTMYFWLIKRGQLLAHGSHLQIIDFIVENDLMDVSEFQYTCEVLEKNDHEVAKLGTCGGFLYSEPLDAINY